MATKKRFFKNIKKPVGNKSVNIREKKLAKQISVQVVQEKREQGQEKPLLPKISQNITENRQVLLPSLKGKPVSYWFVLAGILLVTFISLIGLFVLGREVFQGYQVVLNRLTLQREMTLWEDISKKYPTYRDANFQVAILAYRLGDAGKEREYVAKTLLIDPNFEPAKQLLE